MLLTLLSALSIGDAFDVMMALRIIPCQNDGTLGAMYVGEIYPPPHLIAGVAWEFK